MVYIKQNYLASYLCDSNYSEKKQHMNKLPPNTSTHFLDRENGE